jgi:hypothetical protein
MPVGSGLIAALSLAAALWSTPTSDQALDGRATYYSQGLMEQVAANRGMSLEGYAGGVALNRAADLRRTVWLEYQGDITGPYLVVDCAQRGAHYEERERRGLIAEVSFEQAGAWHMLGPTDVRVLFSLPDPPGAM